MNPVSARPHRLSRDSERDIPLGSNSQCGARVAWGPAPGIERRGDRARLDQCQDSGPRLALPLSSKYRLGEWPRVWPCVRCHSSSPRPIPSGASGYHAIPIRVEHRPWRRGRAVRLIRQTEYLAGGSAGHLHLESLPGATRSIARPNTSRAPRIVRDHTRRLSCTTPLRRRSSISASEYPN